MGKKERKNSVRDHLSTERKGEEISLQKKKGGVLVHIFERGGRKRHPLLRGGRRLRKKEKREGRNSIFYGKEKTSLRSRKGGEGERSRRKEEAALTQLISD